jgi:hypothetical protein
MIPLVQPAFAENIFAREAEELQHLGTTSMPSYRGF